MEFPPEIQRLIHDFVRPIFVTKSDWRKGCRINRIKNCYCSHKCGHSLRNTILHKIYYNSRFEKNITERIIVPICELNCEFPNYYLVEEEEYRKWKLQLKEYCN